MNINTSNSLSYGRRRNYARCAWFLAFQCGQHSKCYSFEESVIKLIWQFQLFVWCNSAGASSMRWWSTIATERRPPNAYEIVLVALFYFHSTVSSQRFTNCYESHFLPADIIHFIKLISRTEICERRAMSALQYSTNWKRVEKSNRAEMPHSLGGMQCSLHSDLINIVFVR